MVIDPDHPDFYPQFRIENKGIIQDDAVDNLRTWEPYQLAKLKFISDAVDEYNQILISTLTEALRSDDVQKNVRTLPTSA